MNTNNTPEADKAERMAYSGEYMVPTEVARNLERERDDAREERDKLQAMRNEVVAANKGAKINAKVSNSLAAKLTQAWKERDEAQAARDILRFDAQREAEHHDRMVGELEKVYDERDEAREKLRMASIEANARQEIANALKERDEYKQERDEAREAATNYYAKIGELESALRRLLTADIPRPLGGIIDDDKRQVAIEWNAFERGEARQNAKAILRQNEEKKK